MCNGSVFAEGEPRVIDRRGKGTLPIGIESFDDIVGHHVYVDKTLLAAELVDRRGVTLFCRPRRFGKSTALRMLQSYFEMPVDDWVDDRGELFEGLAIMDAGREYVRERGAHPVIYLALNACGGDTWDQMRDSIARQIAREYRRHGYLLDSPRMLRREREKYEDIYAEEMTDSDLEGSLVRLATLLRFHHRSQVIILIDEYDKVVAEGHLHGYRDEATSFLKRWLTGALKGTVDLFFAALTGVQRVSKESIFSDLNNFRVDSPLNRTFSRAFGFTEEEAGLLCRMLGHADRLGELKDWYDGYDFGGTAICNPWSVLNYLDGGCVAQPYWTNTSSNDVVRRLVARAGEDANAGFTTLAEGGEVTAPLDLAVVFGEIDSKVTALWSQLYLAGYVTTDDVAEPNNDMVSRRFRAPNLEVRRLFARELIERAVATMGSREALVRLHGSLAAGDARGAQAELKRTLLDVISWHDLHDERSCQRWVLSLLYGIGGYRFPRSEGGTDEGRPVIVCEPEAAQGDTLPVIEVETRYAEDVDEAGLTALAASACEKLAPAQSATFQPSAPAGKGTLRFGIALDAQRHVAVAVVQA